jgi:hypothetical protein
LDDFFFSFSSFLLEFFQSICGFRVVVIASILQMRKEQITKNYAPFDRRFTAINTSLSIPGNRTIGVIESAFFAT